MLHTRQPQQSCVHQLQLHMRCHCKYLIERFILLLQLPLSCIFMTCPGWCQTHVSLTSPVRPVQLVQVNIVCLQALKAAVNGLSDVSSTEGGRAISDPCHLG